MAAALFFTMQATAQTQFATLVHNDTLSSFTGVDALSEAMAAAADGDVITLSSGTFNGCTISKAITLRGAGMEADEQGRQTRISGQISVNLTSKDLSLEGLFISNAISFATDNANVFLNKCTINKVNPESISSYTKIRNFIVTNCKISNVEKSIGSVDLKAYNSYIAKVNQRGYYCFYNCIIDDGYSSASANYYPGIYYNCILSGNHSFSGTADHCVTTFAVDADHGSNNYVVEDVTTLFSNYDAEATWYTRDLTLTDEAKTKYIGSDGTEVGIYGGSLPFSPWLDRPFIKRLTVAPKSTRDGKLSVDIEVGDAE